MKIRVIKNKTEIFVDKFFKYSMEYQITQSNLSLGKHKIKALKNGKKRKFGEKKPKSDTQNVIPKRPPCLKKGTQTPARRICLPLCISLLPVLHRHHIQVSTFRQGVLAKFTVVSALLPPAYVQAMRSPQCSHLKQRSLFHLGKQWMHSKELQEDYVNVCRCN